MDTKTTLYKRGRYGNNVINFQHPTREQDEVTGLFQDIDKASYKEVFFICRSDGVAVGACYMTYGSARVALAGYKLAGNREYYIAKIG
jgi:hypothetical protein